MRKDVIPLNLEADNINDPFLAWNGPSGLFQLLRTEAARDLGMLSDTEMAKAEYRLQHFNEVTIMNPFTGERRKVTR